LLLAAVAGVAQQTALRQTDPQAAVFPLTTKSPEARRLVEEGMRLFLGHFERGKGLETLRSALQIDPKFAIGHQFLAVISLDSAEQVSEQEKAFATRNRASQAEQLVIEWHQDAANNNLMSAIPKMNAVLHQYPSDKWVVWLAIWWLFYQRQYERAIAIYQRSGIIDSPGLINDTTYNYAYLRQFDNAFKMMDRYIVALPNEANPQDSYAEILRMGGRFNQAISHYRAALAINPHFYDSQFGIADTYSLMGDEVRARQEYEIGFQKFSLPELQWIEWRTRKAVTFVREGNYEAADRALQIMADYARSREDSLAEADTYRQMALYQQNSKQALIFLSKAEAAAREGHNAPKAALLQEGAQILRVRVQVALKMTDKNMADSNLARLAEMAESSNDKQIEFEYHGAAGAVLFSEHKYEQAISHLEEDPDNPFSLQLLVAAYQRTGYSSGAQRTSEILADLNEPTLEQALVVPAFRKCYDTSVCSGSAKDASLRR